MSGWVREAPEGLFVVANYTGHYVHRDDPALVTHAVGRIVYPDVTRQLREALASGGGEGVAETYRAMKRRYPPERFDEDLLNTLGYGLLGDGRTDDAIAVFELNVEAYPESPNPFDSLGDAYGAAGRLEAARRSYERAVERAELRGHPNLAYFRSNLERVTQQLEEP
jgi:tetratricopeptide (TPR) repeat protein